MTFYLRDNGNGAEGASALADALKRNTSLTTIDLWKKAIGAEGASTLADALKVNTSVTTIGLAYNAIGSEGASALADALKVNASVTNLYLSVNAIGDEGALVLADALKMNTSVTNLYLRDNAIDDEGASALVDMLQVNTSVTKINLDGNGISTPLCVKIDNLIACNERLRQLFLFDARRMLLSVLCADECGVLWPYVLDAKDALTGVSLAAGTVETLRAEFAAVVEERRRRDPCRPVLVADLHVLQRKNAEQSNQIATLSAIVSGQTSQIADLQRSTGIIVEQNQQMQEQNQQMQEQMRQMHALLMSREQETSADVDHEGDKRAVKRRRTGR
jgi:hypothetical protein